MGSGSQSGQGGWVSTDLPAHLLHVAATRARVVKGEVGPFVVPGPLDLHRSLLHKNLSGLGPGGPEAAVGWAVPGSGLCMVVVLQEGSATPSPTRRFPFQRDIITTGFLERAEFGEPARALSSPCGIGQTGAPSPGCKVRMETAAR